MKNSPILSIVVPCFNEEEVLSETIDRLSDIVKQLVFENIISDNSFILFVDDGSIDKTWEIISRYNELNKRITGLKLAINAGHQFALLAGLMEAKNYSDCVISIDADLQDDITLIKEFIVHYSQGYDIVYGVRKERKSDTFFKRVSAQSFYKLMERLGVNVIYNHADYRLMSKRALDQLSKFGEKNLFLRGLIPLIGYKSKKIYYDRLERFAGESKYPLRKMIYFALEGITSFSIKPVRMVTIFGFLMFFLSVFLGIYAVTSKIIGTAIPGWSSLMVSIWFIGGVQLIGLGLIGEYIGKIYSEVKNRPLYNIESKLELTFQEPYMDSHKVDSNMERSVNHSIGI